MEDRRRTPSPKKHSVRFADQHRTVSTGGKSVLKRKNAQQHLTKTPRNSIDKTGGNFTKNVTIVITSEFDGNGPDSCKNVTKIGVNNQKVESINTKTVQDDIDKDLDSGAVDDSLANDNGQSITDNSRSKDEANGHITIHKGDQESNEHDKKRSEREGNKSVVEEQVNDRNKNTTKTSREIGGKNTKLNTSTTVKSTMKSEQKGEKTKTQYASDQPTDDTVGGDNSRDRSKSSVSENRRGEKASVSGEASDVEQVKIKDVAEATRTNSGRLRDNSRGRRSTSARRGSTPAKSPSDWRDSIPARSPSDRRESIPARSPSGRRDSTPVRTPSGRRDSTPARTPSGRRDSQPARTPSGRRTNTPANSSGRRTSTPGKGVQKFLDYYEEILQKKLRDNPIIRPLVVKKHVEVTEESSDDSESDQDKDDQRSSDRPPSRTRVHHFQHDDDNRHVFNVKWHRKYLLKRKAIAEDMQRAVRRELVLKRFRKVANLIIYCYRCVKDHCFRFRERSDLAPYMNTLESIDYMNDHVTDLMFDRSLFIANRKMKLQDDIKRILIKDKAERSESEIYTVTIALRNIKSFTSLPARMQRLIAQAGTYETYEPRRVITREGHPPTSFYFILSGTVVAMQMDPERPIAKRIEEYMKGDSFEENVMIYESPRTMTMITKETCEFLSISMADFQEIYMQDGVKTLNDPDMGLFLKRLSCLNGWPIELLKQHPKEFRFRHFKNGTTLTDDTKQTDWLIIVKSGSISLLKKLKKVGPYEWRKQGIKPLTAKERRDREAEKQHWRRYVLQEIRCPLKQRGEFEEIEERVDGKPKPFQHPDIKVHSEDTSGGRKYYYPNLWTIKSGAEEDPEAGASSFSNINKQYLYVMSGQSKKTSTAPSGKVADRNSKSAKVKGSKHGASSATQRPYSERDSRPVAVSPEISLRSILNSPAQSIRTTSTEFEDRVHQIAAGIDINLEPLTEADLNPQFVKIQTLTKGDVWGLTDLLLDDQPSFLVVSNGADCVLLNKDFYLQHCPEKLRRKMEQELCPYPSDDNLQANLQVRVDWQDYRQCELSATMETVAGIRQLSTDQPPIKHSVCT